MPIVSDPNEKLTDEEMQSFIRQGMELPIRIAKKDWKKTGNPLYVFYVFQICGEYNIPTPEWVLDYFSEVASRMLEIDPDKNPRASEEVYKALAMNKPGRGNHFSEYRDRQENIALWQLVTAYKKKNPLLSMEEIFRKVSAGSAEKEKKYSWQIVRSLYYKTDKELSSIKPK